MNTGIIVGAVGGLAVGFVASKALGGGDYATIRPKISLSPNTVPAGGTYSMVLENFPPNKQLIASRNASVAGGDLVNMGTTDSTGKLVLNGLTGYGPAGNYYFVVWDALTGQYCAMAMLVVT